MTSEKRLMKRTIPFLLIGLLIFICYLYFFVGIPEIVTIIQRVDLFYYSLAVVVLLLNMVAYALTWHYFLRPLSVNVPFRKTLLFTWIGTFVDLMVPAESISGDASRAYLMSKDSGENAGKVAASIVSHRILAMVITLGSLIIGFLSLLILKFKLPVFVLNSILLVTVGIAISLIFVFLLCVKEQLTYRIIDSILRFSAFIFRGRLQLESLRSKTKKALKVFHQSIEALGRNPRSLVQPVVYSILAWLLSLLMVFLVFVSLGYTVSLSKIVIVYSVICAIQNVPVGILAGVGPIEILMSSLYSLLGVPLGVSASATVLTRLITVWFRILVGFVATQWFGIRVLMGSSR